MAAAVKCVACVGAGRVGGVTTIVLANQAPDVHFILFDDDIDRVRSWRSGQCVFYEPGLVELLRKVLDRGNLTVTHDLEEAVQKAEVIMVCLNTPTKTYGVGAGVAPDLSSWENVARRISKYANGDKVVVESSTMPVKLGEAMRAVLDANTQGHRFDIVCLPSFIRGGSAVSDLESPERLLIGGNISHPLRGVDKVVSLFECWVSRQKIITTNLWSAELSKLALNAYKACRMSSTNAVSALCEATGANLSEVMHAVGTDSRLGSACLQPSPGFGGACLRQNLLTLVYLCRHYGLTEIADFWEMVLTINDYQRQRFTQGILRHMSSVCGRRLAVLGFAYKNNTNDTRESPAIDVCKALQSERAELAVYDPQVTRSAVADHLGQNVKVMGTAYEACEGADAVIILTEWDEFRRLDWQRIYDGMTRPAYVFDSRALVDAAALSRMGFTVSVIGQPSLKPESQ